MTTAPNFAHTQRAENNRKRKANRLAAAAVALGLQPYELAIVGGGDAQAEARREVRRAAGEDRDPSVESWHVAMGFLEGRARSLPGTRECRACGYPVLEVITEEGRRVLLDPFPNPFGTVWPVTTPAGQRARILDGHRNRPEGEALYRQHTVSCPSAPPAPRSPAPRCRVCGQTLNPALAAADPTYTTHPGCEDSVDGPAEGSSVCSAGDTLREHLRRLATWEDAAPSDRALARYLLATHPQRGGASDD